MKESFCGRENDLLRMVDGINEPDNFGIYLKEIETIPLLTPSREIFLAKIIMKGKGAEKKQALGRVNENKLQEEILRGNRARRLFIRSNLRLVINIAKEDLGKGVSFWDLVQGGNEGLIRAADKYDWSRGFRFSTYATFWIRQGVKRTFKECKEIISVPFNLIESKDFGRIADIFDNGYGKTDADEIAKETGIEKGKVNRILACLDKTIMSLDQTDDEDRENQGRKIINEIETEDLANYIHHEVVTRELENILSFLAQDERSILEFKFGTNGNKKAATLRETGRKFGMSERNARQIITEILIKANRVRNGAVGIG